VTVRGEQGIRPLKLIEHLEIIRTKRTRTVWALANFQGHCRRCAEYDRWFGVVKGGETDDRDENTSLNRADKRRCGIAMAPETGE
jgi:hypothetical protein